MSKFASSKLVNFRRKKYILPNNLVTQADFSKTLLLTSTHIEGYLSMFFHHVKVEDVNTKCKYKELFILVNSFKYE